MPPKHHVTQPNFYDHYSIDKAYYGGIKYHDSNFISVIDFWIIVYELKK